MIEGANFERKNRKHWNENCLAIELIDCRTQVRPVEPNRRAQSKELLREFFDNIWNFWVGFDACLIPSWSASLCTWLENHCMIQPE